MSESSKQVPKKDQLPKSKHLKKPRKSLNPLPTKVVIRHLPPTLTSEQFVEQVAPISDHNYYYYVKGDPLLGEFSFSRAYINFINQEDIIHFREKFDNFVFIDDKGNEYTAIVELALYQGVPKRTKKIDLKSKTIENDPNFIQFVENKENLNKPDTNLPSLQDTLEEIEAKEKVGKTEQSTPLLEYINNVNNKKLIEVKKRSRDHSREKRRREERDRKRKDQNNKSTKSLSSMKISSNKQDWPSISNTNKESNSSNGSKEPRKRYRRRRSDEKKKSIDSTDKNSSSSTNVVKSIKEPVQTFTVKILKNENRVDKSTETKDASSKSDRLNESNKKSIEKVPNKSRPSIQLYRPSPRSSFQNNDQKEEKKTSQDKSTRERRN